MQLRANLVIHRHGHEWSVPAVQVRRAENYLATVKLAMIRRCFCHLHDQSDRTQQAQGGGLGLLDGDFHRAFRPLQQRAGFEAGRKSGVDEAVNFG